MSGFPRITFGIIVLNGEPFTRYCLRALYPFAHEIIVVEGATINAAAIATPHGHSTDDTLEVLRSFKADEDPEDKVHIIVRNGFWSEKDEQSQAYAEKATGDYLWQVDIDEFYKPEDIEKIIALLSKDRTITGASFQTINFWGGFDYCTDGWWNRENNRYFFRRLFKWGQEYRYVSHRPPTVIDEQGNDLVTLNWISGKSLAARGIFLYHYSYVFPAQVRRKCIYFDTISSQKNRKKWFETQYLNISNPYRLNLAYWLPGWITRFKGKHPSIIYQLIKDLDSGKIQIQLRRTNDIERLLSRKIYRLNVQLLNVLYALGIRPIQKVRSSFFIRKFFVRSIIRLINLVFFRIPPLFRRMIPRFIKDWFRSRLWGYSPPLYDIKIDKLSAYNYLGITGQPKRALLSYITMPFRLSASDNHNIQFSNIGISRSIVRVLNELGYIVDVIEYTDCKFIPHRKYELFIGHGGYNFEHIEHRLSQDTTKIYFSTGIYWKEFNRREAERFRLLENRRGILLPYDRWITCSEEYANRSVEAIICLGNENARLSYSQFPLVFNVNNASYADNHYDLSQKDFPSARRHFLFFAGEGNVHRGLDLLLEAFVHVDAHLYICQKMSPEFYETYKRELESYPNIHLIGWITMRSFQFYKLVDKCAFIIHPSCAEGQPGSVVECMHQGLIPVVSRETNIDTNGYGIMLNKCSIEEIIKVVHDLTQQSPEQCERMSRRTRKVAVTRFSEEAFLKNFRDAINYILARNITN